MKQAITDGMQSSHQPIMEARCHLPIAVPVIQIDTTLTLQLNQFFDGQQGQALADDV
jgi:hypothetical protein